MKYYAIQVWTGKEEDFISLLSCNEFFNKRLFAPKRAINIRFAGKTKKTEKIIFPGYVFYLALNDELDISIAWEIRRTKYFARFLPNSQNPHPLIDRDFKTISHFISFGKVADISKVSFDINQKIHVLSGPLAGYEGMIIKVDRRKGRAKIELDMCSDKFVFDLGFEVIEKADKKTEA